ncbi:MAG: hypothetical protein RJB38_1947 [Pseudomonadota bacterium]|jgi:putative nucleotidyltransferase with HDIG domain
MNHVPIRLHTLRPDASVLFDVFIRVGEKHIHYIRANEPFDGDRIERLRSKGVKKLFVRQEDETLYLEYLDQGLSALSGNSRSTQEKGALAHDTLVTDAENIERSMETEEGFRRVEGRVNKVVEFLQNEKGALKGIMEAAGCSADDFQHGANVASMASALALRVGGVTPRELLDLSFGALVHDIGKSKAPAGEDPKTSLKRHPERGVEVLAAKKFVTPGILRLVVEHEEIGEGQGYPEKKKIESMHVTSQILSLCNHFDRVATQKQIVPTELMKVFFQEKADLFDLNHITILGELLNGK